MFTRGNSILIKGCSGIGPAYDHVTFRDGEGTTIEIDTATLLRLLACWEADMEQILARSKSTRTIDDVKRELVMRSGNE